MTEPNALLSGVLLTLLTLLVSHLALWNHRSTIPRVAPYAIGCLCIATGMALTSWLSGDWTPLLVYGAHLIPSGLLVGGLWYGRLRAALREEAAKDAAGIEELARRHERTY